MQLQKRQFQFVNTMTTKLFIVFILFGGKKEETDCFCEQPESDIYIPYLLKC